MPSHAKANGNGKYVLIRVYHVIEGMHDIQSTIYFLCSWLLIDRLINYTIAEMMLEDTVRKSLFL